ncbi:hypothetical protein Tco_0635474 [Tanacetum coccineum]
MILAMMGRPPSHDLADSDVEDLINDDDGCEKMADVARAHGGDGGGEDPSRPPPTSFGCAGCFINRGKNILDIEKDKAQSPIWADVKAAGRPDMDPGTMYLRMRWPLIKAGQSRSEGPRGGQGEADGTLGASTYNLEPHMRSERWPRIEGYIQAQKSTSGNQEEPSEITGLCLHTVNGVFQDPDGSPDDRMRELEATGEHTTAEINAMVRGGKLRGHIPGVGPGCRFFMMSLMRSDNRFADAFARYDSGGASGSGGSRARDREDGDDMGGRFPSDMSLGKILPPWHQFLDQKIYGAHFSLGIVARERFAIELTPSTFPQRHFAGGMFPQRHVAGEKVGMLLGKASNVVMFNGGVEMLSLYMRCLTDESRCYRYTLDVQRMRQMLSLYTLNFQRRSRDVYRYTIRCSSGMSRELSLYMNVQWRRRDDIVYKQ